MNRFNTGLLLATLLFASAALADDGPRIEQGSKVSFNYALSLEDGTQLESNMDTAPMAYTQGAGQIIPGLEDAMLGHAAGDRFSVTIPPEQAYGPVDPKRVQPVPIENVPEAARVVGATLTATNFPGPIIVREVREDTVLLDFNHPLAGKTLTFDISVVSVEAPAALP